MNPTTDKPRPTTSQVTAWLDRHHPEISYEIHGTWVWITTPIKDRPQVRESIRERCRADLGCGFQFKAHGPDHVLPSGATSRWAHSCEAPRAKKGMKKAAGPTTARPPQPQRKESSTTTTPEPTPPASSVSTSDPVLTDQERELAELLQLA